MTVIMPGAEPFFFKRGPTGVLLTHGFTASPQEVRQMGTYLAGKGFSALGIRLAGHGTSLEELGATHWQDWLHSLEDGHAMLQSHCESIVLAGFSTGGVLSLLYSTEVQVDGIITMSTPIDLPPGRTLRLLYPILKITAPVLPPIPKGPPDWFDEQALQYRVAYSAYSAEAVVQFGKLVRRLKPALPQVKAPILMMHSTNDDFIPIQQMRQIHDAVGSTHKEVFTVDQSGHIITCDAERDRVFHRAEQFIHGLNSSQV
ncbi:MAG: alpha/beta fold hydrolase [Anaerolineales bacterium]|nr:alpha/beta fold hydrolase [Anaerolineales bacterium]